MKKVIGVSFRSAGKVYFFDPLEFDIKKGDHVIVETARGIEFGRVASGVKEVEDDKVIQPLKPVLRIANEKDIEQEKANKEKEREAFKVCKEKILKHNLEMKLIDAEYTFDNNKILFYFTADGRIDFRDLVKDLAGVFKTRIELRQIGVRDETKILGGLGICGRVLCCHSFLSDFAPVSIKMAKEQNLSLNPTKISGVCGRLMCCLNNEEETYEYLNRQMPGVGDEVTTQDGEKGKVHSVNILRQLVKVIFEEGDEKELKEFPVAELTFVRRKKGKGKNNQRQDDEVESAELKALEEADLQDNGEDQENKGNQRGHRKNRDHNDENRGKRDNQRNRGDRNRDGQGDKNRDGQSGDRSHDKNRDGQGADKNHDSANDGNESNESGRSNNRRGRDRRNRDNRNRENAGGENVQNENREDGHPTVKENGQNAEGGEHRRRNRHNRNRNRKKEQAQGGTETE